LQEDDGLCVFSDEDTNLKIRERQMRAEASIKEREKEVINMQNNSIILCFRPFESVKICCNFSRGPDFHFPHYKFNVS
jgi:hypothetical protein